jgi:hypothetical protein
VGAGTGGILVLTDRNGISLGEDAAAVPSEP